MKQTLVMTLIGRDRPGLVEAVAAIVEAHGGNWEESRMVQLAGQFAGLLRIQAPAEGAAELDRALRDIEGVSVIVARAVEEPAPRDTRFLELDVVGQDHPGIVRGLAAALAAGEVNVEELETEVVDAPMSGERLFQARARLKAPVSLTVDELRSQLERLAADLIVEVSLEEPRNGA
jgi:glycine cleavage system regulatory protein